MSDDGLERAAENAELMQRLNTFFFEAFREAGGPCPTCGGFPGEFHRLGLKPGCPIPPTPLTSLAEEGRRLASQRDDLIVSGVDPADLTVPIHPGAADS